MSIKSALGLGSSKKVRYGIVALGDISQKSLMPGVKHTGNSEVSALITGDPEKARAVGKQYDVPADAQFGYEQFDAFLKSGKADAIYLATPNWRTQNSRCPRCGLASTCCSRSRWRSARRSAARSSTRGARRALS